MLKDIGTFLNLCYGFRGRISCGQFACRLLWVPFIGYFPLLPIFAIMGKNGFDFSGWSDEILTTPFVWGLSTLAVKRLRDIGKSSIWVVAYFGGGVSLALTGQHLLSGSVGSAINAAGLLLLGWGVLELLLADGKPDLLPPDCGQ